MILNNYLGFTNETRHIHVCLDENHANMNKSEMKDDFDPLVLGLLIYSLTQTNKPEHLFLIIKINLTMTKFTMMMTTTTIMMAMMM
jgi:hypothetical protein